MAIRFPPQDPNALLDYELSWATAMAMMNDTIVSSVWSTPHAEITIEDQSNTTTTTKVWVSGGIDMELYTLTNHIVTAGGREDERDCILPIRNL